MVVLFRAKFKALKQRHLMARKCPLGIIFPMLSLQLVTFGFVTQDQQTHGRASSQRKTILTLVFKSETQCGLDSQAMSSTCFFGTEKKTADLILLSCILRHCTYQNQQ